MNYRKNAITGGFLFAVSAGYLALTMEIKPFKGLGAPPIDARFVPQLWGGLLMLLSVLLLIRSFREYKAFKAAGNSLPKLDLIALVKDNASVVLTFLSLFVYIALMQPVGFLIMSVLYIFVQTLILSPKGKMNWKIALIVAIVAAVIIDFFFARMLHVLLPKGILGF